MPICGKIMIIIMIKKTHSSSSKSRTAQMMSLSLFAMTGLEKCILTSAYLQWLFHSGERAVARWPLVSKLFWLPSEKGTTLNRNEFAIRLISYYLLRKSITYIRPQFDLL